MAIACCAMRVMTLERRPLSFHRSLVRSVLGLLLLGYAFVIPFHPLGRGVHDIVTGTMVVEGNYPDPVFIAAKRDDRRDRRIAAVAVSCAVVAATSVLAGALR